MMKSAHQQQKCVHSGLWSIPEYQEWPGCLSSSCKAYDIIQKLSTPEMTIKPPTVYRAIDFLLEQGFIHKIESINAFIACYHQHNTNDYFQLFICDECGTISEQSDDKLYQQLNRGSHQTGFTIRQPVVEVHGICAKCNQ